MSGPQNSPDPRDDASEVKGWIIRIVIASVLGLGWLVWLLLQ